MQLKVAIEKLRLALPSEIRQVYLYVEVQTQTVRSRSPVASSSCLQDQRCVMWPVDMFVLYFHRLYADSHESQLYEPLKQTSNALGLQVC